MRDTAADHVLFQSTLPGWGATTNRTSPRSNLDDFNPRSPDGERRAMRLITFLPASNFNPRSPDGERPESSSSRKTVSAYFNPRSPDGERPTTCPTTQQSALFQSTLPGWGATCLRSPVAVCFTYFNPRSPDGERLQLAGTAANRRYFNPRSPDGERRRLADIDKAYDVFQSTLPGWGATSHAHVRPTRARHFNPRSPDGERHVTGVVNAIMHGISIHAPRMGSDSCTCLQYPVLSIFQSTLPGWGATITADPRTKLTVQFQSTLPGWGATGLLQQSGVRK